MGEVRGEGAHAAAQALPNHGSIDEFELLDREEQRALSRYRVEDVSLYEFLRSVGVLRSSRSAPRRASSRSR
jgi:hypothetical protein